MTKDIATMINQYGFPIIAAFGMGGLIYFVWKWVTTEIKPVMSETSKTLIALVDRIRMLDNDLIRLNTKLNVILEHQEELEKKKNREAQNKT
jgi:hypothetical protein